MRFLPLASLLLAGVALTGCATATSRQPDPRDPFERFNRASFAFNEKLDRTVARPAARFYVRVVPRLARTGVTNFFANIEQPAVFLNDVLQGKPRPAANDLGRFLLNSTIGLGGLLDPASAMGLDRNEEDFGQTLGRWSLRPGPYLVVPLFGPRSVRDGFGDLVDRFADPSSYIEDDGVRWGLLGLELLDQRARLLEIEEVLDRAFDRYAFVRNAYLQRRAYLVSDGEVPEEPLEDPALLEEEAGESAPTPEAPPPR